MSAVTTSQELLKMLATSAVTVLTSYQAITAHIDTTVTYEVRRSSEVLEHRLQVRMDDVHRRAKAHTDSLHLVHVSEWTRVLERGHKRGSNATF